MYLVSSQISILPILYNYKLAAEIQRDRGVLLSGSPFCFLQEAKCISVPGIKVLSRSILSCDTKEIDIVPREYRGS